MPLIAARTVIFPGLLSGIPAIDGKNAPRDPTAGVGKEKRDGIGDIERRPDAAAIVRAVVALGNSLGMVTCAEGVETGEQLSYLRSEGCVEMQGFYYSKPKPLADVVTMMRATHAKLAIPLQPVDFEEYGLTTDIRLPAA